jgi:YidC/Oxa1 family membrane protein insertase
MDTQRLILFVIFSFSLVLLWDAWQKEQQRPAPPASGTSAATRNPEAVPSPSRPQAKSAAQAPETRQPASGVEQPQSGEAIEIRTDLYVARVNTLGGTLEWLELLNHKDTVDPTKNLVLLGPEHRYTAQSGLTGEQGPNHRSLWRAAPGERALPAGADTLELRLRAERPDGVSVDKLYVFRRASYVIDVSLQVRNGGSAPLATHAYFQLTHDGKTPAGGDTLAQSFGAQSFLGFAVYTSEKKFEKVDFSDVDKAKTSHVKQAKDGWLAFVQHYFVAAWLPTEGQPREFVVEKRNDGVYAGRVVSDLPTIAPGETAQSTVPIYVGPQEQSRLKEAAPGLDLVVDYGWLTIIAWPLFWLLERLHAWTGNWGVAIILLTVIIKIVFFPLSAASYRSMAKMKLINPRLMKLRETYGDDRAKLNQAMMELYKTEKINPLGGCFPILVQIPVFIALYWVLLAAIELRHTPFILWIKDLSALDPYFVLPTLMAVTMVIQTRMNPKPPDPVQAKVMAVMPYVFSVFFYFFPAGLVLYWLVNNVLSILQQWQIQRLFEREKPAAPKR